VFFEIGWLGVSFRSIEITFSSPILSFLHSCCRVPVWALSRDFLYLPPASFKQKDLDCCWSSSVRTNPPSPDSCCIRFAVFPFPIDSIMAALVESWTKTQLAIFFVILLLAVDE
jgi:hypothetical protein